MLLIKVQPLLAGGPEGYPCPGKLDGGVEPFPCKLWSGTKLSCLSSVFHFPLSGLYRPWHKQGTRLEEFIHLSHLLPAINYILHLVKMFKQKPGIRRDEIKEGMKK